MSLCRRFDWSHPCPTSTLPATHRRSRCWCWCVVFAAAITPELHVRRRLRFKWNRCSPTDVLGDIAAASPGLLRHPSADHCAVTDGDAIILSDGQRG